jgi:hypothetical protein
MSILNRFFSIFIIMLGLASAAFGCKKEGTPLQSNSENNFLNASGKPPNPIIPVDECNETITSNNCLIYNKTESKPFYTTNLALEAKNGSVAFIFPEQPNVTGHKSLYWDTEDAYKNGSTDIDVKLVNKESLTTKIITLTGQRYLGYGFNSSVNNAVTSFEPRVGTLYISFDKAKNPNLKGGNYYGEFIVQAKGWLDSSYSKDIKVNITIDQK